MQYTFPTTGGDTKLPDKQTEREHRNKLVSRRAQRLKAESYFAVY